MVSYKKFTLAVVIGAIGVVFAGCDGCGCDDKDKNTPGGDNDWQAMKATDCSKVYPDNNAGIKIEDAKGKTAKEVEAECTEMNKKGAGKTIDVYPTYCVGIEFKSTEAKKNDDAKGTGKLYVTEEKYEKTPKDDGNKDFPTEKEPNNKCLTSKSGLKYAREGQKEEKTDAAKSFAQTQAKRGSENHKNHKGHVKLRHESVN